MPRFRVKMERPTVEFREVVVEADDADDAKLTALSTEFDEPQLDDWVNRTTRASRRSMT
jgi:hypothetical protein